MANMFYIPVRDSDGDVMPNVSVGVYLDANCTQPATTIAPGPVAVAGIFSTDADGDQFIYVTDPNTEMLYFRCVGQTVVVPIRCANQPLPSDYDTATPASGDYVLFGDITDGNKLKKCTASSLLTVSTDYVKTDGTVGTIRSGTGVPADGLGTNGDLYVRVPT